jgi:tetratricopeptide (TPR) repeat protein
MASRRIKLEDQIAQAKQVLEAGEVDQAIAICRYIFRYYPRCLEVTRLLGEAYTEKQLFDEAEQLLTFALNAEPQDVLSYVDRGFVAYGRNQVDEAISSYERALELDPSIEQLRKELLRLYVERYGNNRPKLRLTKAGLANRRMRDGFYNQASEEYAAILRENPQRLDVQVGLLESYWRSKDYARTESLANELLTDYPWLIKANLLLWHIYGVRRRLDKASTYLERAQTLDPLYLIAQHLFEDPVSSDNAMSYLAMLGVATIPVFDASQPFTLNPNDLLPSWVTSETTSDDAGPDFAKPAQAGQEVSLADLGLDSDLIMSLIADTEQQTAQRQEEALRQQQVEAEKSRSEALSDLEQLRSSSEENEEFGGWLEDLSVNAPQVDLNAVESSPKAGTNVSPDLGLDELEPFDLSLGAEHENLYQFFDELEGAEQSAPSNPSNSQQPLAAFDPLALEAEQENSAPTDVANWDQMKPFDFDFEAVDSAEPSNNPPELSLGEVAINEDLAKDQPLEPWNYATAAPQVELDGYNDDDNIMENQQRDQYAHAAQPALAAHAFHLRDEQGPLPDFVVAKEKEQMPIKRGGNEDNNVFDWEKEELPDYLQAFAMDEDEAANYGLASPTSPQADITTTQARIRPRGMDVTGENDIPEWLNPATTRPPTPSRPNGEIVDLSGSPRANVGGSLPSWLDAADLEDNSARPSPNLGLGGSSFGMEDMQPFSLDGFGNAPASPAPSPSPAPNPARPPARNQEPQMNVFNPNDLGDDMMPFSLGNIDGSPSPMQPAAPTPPSRPTPTPPPSNSNSQFNLGGVDDMGLGDLLPFNPGGGASPDPRMGAPAPAPSPQMSPTPQPPKPVTQPISPSPRQPTMPRATPAPPSAPSPFEDMGMGDLQPFSFGNSNDESQRMSGARASTPKSEPSFEPKFPAMGSFPGADNAEGDFQDIDLNGMQPFSLDAFGAESAPSIPSKPAQPSIFSQPPPSAPAPSNFGRSNASSDFDLPEDFGPDLEPFAPGGFGEIPGLTAGPARINNVMDRLPEEPFMPSSSSSRPRQAEIQLPAEPGHEAPLQNYKWLRDLQRKAEEDKGPKLFQKLAQKNQEQKPEQIIATSTNPASNKGNYESDHIMSFEEVEALSAQPNQVVPQTQAQTPLTIDSQNPNFNKVNQEINQEINNQLNQGLEVASFNMAVDTTLKQPPNLQFSEPEGFQESLLNQTTASNNTSSFEDIGFPPPFDLNELTPKASQPTVVEPTFEAVGAEPTLPEFVEFNLEDFNSSATTNPTKLENPDVAGPEFDLGTFGQGLTHNQPEQTQASSSFYFGNLEETPFKFMQEQQPPATDTEPAKFDFGAFSTDFGTAPSTNNTATHSQESKEFDFLEDLKGLEGFKGTEDALATPAEAHDLNSFDLSTPSDLTDLESFKTPTESLPDFKGFETANPDQGKAETFSFETATQMMGDFENFTGGSGKAGPVEPLFPDFGEDTAPKIEDQGLNWFNEPATQAKSTTAAKEPSTVPSVQDQVEALFDEPFKGLTEEPAKVVDAQPVFPKVETAQVPEKTTPTQVEVSTPISSAPTTNGNGNGAAKAVADTASLDTALQVVKNNPRDASANLQLAEAYLQQGQAPQAITYYTGAIKGADSATLEQIAQRLRSILGQRDANPRFHHVLGDVYMKQGQHNLALNEYQLALGRNKSSAKF